MKWLRRILGIEDEITELRADVEALKAWKEQVEAAWPEVTNVIS